MARVIAVVEGSTEQAFIQRVLAPHLAAHGVHISARVIGEPGHKGGNVQLPRVIRDVSILLKQEPTTHVTTLIDRYGLGRGWPTIHRDVSSNPARASKVLCESMRASLLGSIGGGASTDRFLPYVQFHETEAFLFIEPDVSARFMGDSNRAKLLLKECDGFETPEHINDRREWAPSKRIQKHFPGYQKGRGLNAHLPRICEAVGLVNIRAACPLFDDWLTQLEDL